MTRLRPGILAILLTGCAARVPVSVPAAPSVHVPGTAIAVISAGRECREVADSLADALHQMDGMVVQPDAPNQITVFACRNAYATVDEHTIEGRSVAIASLASEDGTNARLLGSAHRLDRAAHEGGRFRLNKRVQSDLALDVAVDLAEQIAPVSTVVRRRVYENPGENSARQYHNLAVAAERDGRIDDALWWARLAWERRPNVARARYVSELTRRLARTEPLSSGDGI
ncbi:MAG: hypothetical protein R3F61_37390 [Myxococcota bacterium]